MQGIKIENEAYSGVLKAYGPYISGKLFGIESNAEFVVNCKITSEME
jgi:hypothetical protein